MLWIKMLHVLGVISWLAGIFYLPRIFMNYVEARAAGEPTARLVAMGVRLNRFMSILSGFAILFGLWLWFGYGIDGKWLHWKLVFVLLLIAYQGVCGVFVRQMKAGTLARTPMFFRIFNEGALLIIVPILIFVIVKPV